MDRSEKRQLVADLKQTFEQASTVVITHYAGLTVAEMGVLRQRMRAAGAGLKVTKNRLTRLALADTAYAHLDDLFTGPTAIAYADDPVGVARVAVEFAAKNEKLVVIGGAMGETRLDVAEVKALASLASLDELRARIVGMLNTPATRIAVVLQQPGAGLARLLNAKAQQDEAA